MIKHELDASVSKSLDDLSPERIQIDTLRCEGPDFDGVDNRLMSLYLVKNGFTDAALFGPDGRVLQPQEALYKKNIVDTCWNGLPE